ncbi:hypothetical protein C0J52_20376 [Blattella germanica]|nr:hypothetical protein C0J52_20376 [Blattella germanica]
MAFRIQIKQNVRTTNYFAVQITTYKQYKARNKGHSHNIIITGFKTRFDPFSLNIVLPAHHWIGRRGKEVLDLHFWTQRSLDLTACDYFLLGYVKEAVYQ